MVQFLISLFLVIGFTGCAQNPPLQEYTLAKTALDAAQNAGGAKYAPSLWFKAEENYREGESLFKNGHFDQATIRFNQSIDFSEKTENKARYEKRKMGEELP